MNKRTIVFDCDSDKDFDPYKWLNPDWLGNIMDAKTY